MEIELYAWVTEVDGKPSLIAALISGFHTPLMSVREETARKMGALAVNHCQATGQKAQLVQFKAVDVIAAWPADA
jgi:hypothetical protein